MVEKRATMRLIQYKIKVTTPSDNRYAKKNIDKIPKGPAVAGVVTFSKTVSKQRLTTDIIKINIFSITTLLYHLSFKVEMSLSDRSLCMSCSKRHININIERVNYIQPTAAGYFTDRSGKNPGHMSLYELSSVYKYTGTNTYVLRRRLAEHRRRQPQL